MTYDVSLMTQDGLAALRVDCARMVPHWVLPRSPWEVERPVRVVGAAGIHGVVVPVSSARLIDSMAGSMAGFGD
ncbi:hypothetical protein GTY65_19250 [Streptomyces sp. SID8379]|uniref:hypothetical protein n=1 Tax=unclassified Streptomyces TaxID=2593676 RepID=UPI0003A5DA36|nr:MULTISPECIES: hypothetical protein [unclassified Streptomyces]MYW66171.1 hypothetical protein [Streptomyces sp. SID8379]